MNTNQNAAHTPGPWEVTGFGSTITAKGQTCDIAMICYSGDERSKEDQANARLIAGAPKLLETLDKLVAVIGLTPLAGNKEAMQEVFDIACAVLTEVTGDQP